jgi:hypothetical protein
MPFTTSSRGFEQPSKPNLKTMSSLQRRLCHYRRAVALDWQPKKMASKAGEGCLLLFLRLGNLVSYSERIYRQIDEK